MTKDKLAPVEYIKQHTDKNYCEALVFSDGYIADAIPSHTNALVLHSPYTFEVVQQIVPMNAHISFWLCEKLNIVLVWYNSVVFPLGYTKQQVATIKHLISRGIISKNCDIIISKEYSHILTDYDNDKLDILSTRYNRRLTKLITLIRSKV